MFLNNSESGVKTSKSVVMGLALGNRVGETAPPLSGSTCAAVGD
ncbi:hypothetical protein [Pseudomonas salmasensis]|nr:hypothetical protein [Pseudomonas salmasensis]